ncbi:Thymidylate synthase [Seminavis robusta]|uniref:Thymidylate synthase n=1 Tax=Seminavis robusta TaxID=568900 RepID=A0A9N8EXN7_9STRA|nr:Thymidylate synthase [Seminavis robusta]|eukprot:Sro2094_g314140.1 Thymidylate synthase (548) ;mRNA; f:5673-7316
MSGKQNDSKSTDVLIPKVTPPHVESCKKRKGERPQDDTKHLRPSTARRRLISNDNESETRANRNPGSCHVGTQEACLVPTDSDASSAIPFSQQLTQPVAYTQDLSAGLDDHQQQPTLLGFLEDNNDPSTKKEIRKDTVVLGRSHSADVTIENESVSREHCKLVFSPDSGTCSLVPLKTCWIKQDNRWYAVAEDRTSSLPHQGRFRLLPPGKAAEARCEGVDFTLFLTATETEEPPAPGSHSFDVQYLKLLRSIEQDGVGKVNKKGLNRALPRSFLLDIDLGDPKGEDRSLLPVTSLRSLYGGRGALIEALWYLRGEDHIQFLQHNKCHFWDKQAIKKGDVDWVGWSYGLLTNFPQANGDQKGINQLEERVIKPLCKHGSCSRNMTCSLDKPGEETVQGACTSGIQFSVSGHSTEEEALNLTINQRSSDVMMGLPHDVVVWSIILHLVRREAWIRAKRKLLAGKLSFVIGQNAAHVYQLNWGSMQEILEREPIPECQPYLVVEDEDLTNPRGIFDLAKNYNPKSLRICNYTKASYHPAITLEQAVEHE